MSLRRARRTALDAAVAWLFRRRGGRDGPPITAALHDLGWKVSKNTVAASMRSQGLVARPKKKRRGLTKADRRSRKAPDLLKRDFAPPPAMSNQRWVSDLTEIPTGEGTLYLASILDLNSRRCVGYALGVHHDADLAAAALRVAIAVRGGDVAGVVLHTDQGGEYTGGELNEGEDCARAGIVQLMGRTGSALDNAVAEAFHSTLEFELLSRQVFATQPDARRAVVTWLEEYEHRPVAFDQRPDQPGQLRARPTPSGRETVRPAAPSPTSSTTPGR